MKNKYIGKTCPYCKTVFKETDDIVLCSACDMPHHKECWVENQGCTTFGCLGTIKSISNSSSSSTAPTDTDFDIDISPGKKIYCPRCGAPNDEENNFCEKCGQTLIAQKRGSPQHTHYTVSSQGAGVAAPVMTPPYATPYTPPAQPYSTQNPAYNQQSYGAVPYASNQYQGTNYQNQGYNYYGNSAQNTSNSAPYSAQEEAGFVGNNSVYYASKFSEMRMYNKNTSWNWCACLFGAHWFAYRKMYLYALAYYGIALVVGILGAIGSLISIGVCICAGLFGNYLYMKKVEQKLQEARGMAEPLRSQHLNKHGGTSVLAVILFDIGVFLLGMLGIALM